MILVVEGGGLKRKMCRRNVRGVGDLFGVFDFLFVNKVHMKDLFHFS